MKATLTVECVSCDSRREIDEAESKSLARKTSMPMCEECGMPMVAVGAKAKVMQRQPPGNFYTGHPGRNDRFGCVMIDDTRPLDPRLDLDNHSPTGFAWGYAGSGPAQLALAILADALGDDEEAVALHQAFKFKMIAGLSQSSGWRLDRAEVLQAVEEIRATRREP